MLIEIKTRKQGWIIVKLLSINKGNTITIIINGNTVKRKIKNVRWGVTYKVAKAQGVSHPLKGDRGFKTKKRRVRKKRIQGRKATSTKQTSSQNKGRRFVMIAGHKVTFL